MKKLLIPLLILAWLPGCAVWTARSASLETKAYALESDYVAIQGVAALYVVDPAADPWIKRSIKEADRRATPAILVMTKVVEGANLGFCDGPEVKAKPVNLDMAFAKASCEKDVPALISKAGVLVGLLNSIMIQIEGDT